MAAAGATSVAAFHEVKGVVDAFRESPQLQLGNDLAIPAPGKPQTIMLIGSDVRVKGASGYGGGQRSDTIILIRLDPSKKTTALLSIPRDLKVSIPGHGIAKINEAYADGGAKLTLETVKEITGLRINHVISVNFLGFVDAVNRLGCVYMDIDHRYYNPGGSFAAIDLQPGYQRICGRDALSFVRFRHTDTDIVRASRQQQFLGQMKQQIGISTLFGERHKLLKIFGKYTRSDIHSTSAVLRLLKLALASAGHPIQQIPFDGTLGASYVFASDSQMHKMAREFIGVASKTDAGEEDDQQEAPPAQARHQPGHAGPDRREQPGPQRGAPDRLRRRPDTGLLPAPDHGPRPLPHPARLRLHLQEPQAFPGLPDGRVQRGSGPARPVLGHPGDRAPEPADSQGRARGAPLPRPGIRPLLRGQRHAHGGVEDQEGRLLGAEHAVRRAQREADGHDRPHGTLSIGSRRRNA